MAFIMNKENTHNRLKEKVVHASNMPKDVVFGVPIITFKGQEEVIIENYRGIIEYTDYLIRVQTKVGQIKIIGKHLIIEYYTNDEMKITGHLMILEYS